jgi:hypothetical protein
METHPGKLKQTLMIQAEIMSLIQRQKLISMASKFDSNNQIKRSKTTAEIESNSLSNQIE